MATDLSTMPSLDAGDHLTRDEFLRIWEQLPNIKRAELIGGIVYMPSPLRKEHGNTDSDITTWLGVYRAHTPGLEGGSNTTSLIGDDCPQPDNYLAILPEYGGASWGKKYVEGSPELLVEVSFSSVSIDLHEKFDLYEENRIQEYLVVLIKRREILWNRLVRGKYKRIQPDSEGIFRSRVFPGLWLDSKALFANDMAKVLTTLQTGIASDEHQRFVAELSDRKASRER
ncbi:MAG: Uma2 family endonuclease [Planctomycetes bacterium]|nr:Uma2 family endonuclease [Planctomycetota bacterium]